MDILYQKRPREKFYAFASPLSQVFNFIFHQFYNRKYSVPLFAILLQYISLYIEELLIVLIPRVNKFFGRNIIGPYGITALYFIFGCICFLMIPSYIFQYVEGDFFLIFPCYIIVITYRLVLAWFVIFLLYFIDENRLWRLCAKNFTAG